MLPTEVFNYHDLFHRAISRSQLCPLQTHSPFRFYRHANRHSVFQSLDLALCPLFSGERPAQFHLGLLALGDVDAEAEDVRLAVDLDDFG